MSDASNVTVRVQVRISPPGEEPRWIFYVREDVEYAALPNIGNTLIIEGVEPSIPEPLASGGTRIGIPSQVAVGAFSVEVHERRITHRAVLLDTGVTYDDELEDEESLNWGEIIQVLENAGYSRWEAE